MEEEVVRLLADTQATAETPRKQAELQLLALYTQPGFGKALISIGSHDSVPTNIRQSALLTLRQFILAGWNPVFEEFRGQILVNDEEKTQLRQMLLELAMSANDERKVKKAASYVVSKIASSDFPDEWPDLLPTVLHIIQTGNDEQLQAALAVLVELIDDCFNDTQFFSVARDLVKAIYDVAVNNAHKYIIRALAVNVFRSCFDILEMVLEDHKAAVKEFADEALAMWIPLFVEIMQSKLPEPPTVEEEEQRSATAEAYRGFVALKLQVVKV